MAISDAALGEIVWGHFNRYDIAGKDTNVIHPDFPGNVG